MMTIGSLFSGIGGLEKGLCDSGLGDVVWQVEKDEYCRAVLAKHWPHVERFDDVTTVSSATLAPVDLICGGFPCQDVSSAGKRVGLAGARSGLWFEFHRVVRELAPAWVVVENVASGARAWVDAVCTGLGELGYACLPVPLSAADVGAPHERARIFIVAANANRFDIRNQSGGGEWSRRQGTSIPANDGETRHIASNTHSLRQHAGAEHAEMALASTTADAQSTRLPLARWTSGTGAQHSGPAHAGWRQTVPPVLRVDDGLSGRTHGASLGKPSHRIKALGNAVVPQCAEVIGHIIQELCS